MEYSVGNSERTEARSPVSGRPAVAESKVLWVRPLYHQPFQIQNLMRRVLCLKLANSEDVGGEGRAWPEGERASPWLSSGVPAILKGCPPAGEEEV